MGLNPRALYASFDRIPSPKGAATHIERFAGALCEIFEGGLVHVLGDADLPPMVREGQIGMLRYSHEHGHFLDRTLGYGQSLTHVLSQNEKTLEICHFRDPWSGIPILNRPHRYRTLYEVNGLPSIELPSTYPLILPSTLKKIRQAEQYCWEQCDVIVTPSQTIAENLARLGADPKKITVIPNGADRVMQKPGRPKDAPLKYVLYFGALQPWQGVDILLRAFQRLADKTDLMLVLCVSSHRRMMRPLMRLAEKLGLASNIVWMQAIPRDQLSGWIAHALASVIPLKECARNLEQGCAPLKAFESMAHGIPIIASDLPSIREIFTDGIDAVLVHPDRPAELARAMRIVLEYPERSSDMGAKAKEKLETHYTWQKSVGALKNLYVSLSDISPQTR